MSDSVDGWAIAEAVLPHADRVLLYGPPGTGKTYAAQSDREGRPVYSVTLTEDTAAVELRGHWVPSAGGAFVWQDGPALRAFREGAVLVINEIDHASPDVLSLIHAICDERGSARLTLPNGETVHRGEGFRCVASMNGKPEDLPAAVRDRFSVAIEIDRPHPRALAALPDDLRAAASGTACHPDADRRISLRSWLAYAALRQTVPAEMAAAAVFGPSRAADVLQSLAIARD